MEARQQWRGSVAVPLLLRGRRHVSALQRQGREKKKKKKKKKKKTSGWIFMKRVQARIGVHAYQKAILKGGDGMGVPGGAAKLQLTCHCARC